jgi:CRISPR/Cas system CSM-associated protein Csm3 (group 7 of RAMP superfamily)
MSTIKYEIEFFSNWHCGSGLAAGADVDSLVIKDKKGLPYIPGRTLKGLLREAASLLTTDIATIGTIFGISGDEKDHKTGCAFFGNATLPIAEYQYIVEQGLEFHLYQSFASTSIDEKGIAKDHSLRKIETVVPCKLEGEILNIPDGAEHVLEDAMRYVKRMGTGRNRGFGRCKISIRKEA